MTILITAFDPFDGETMNPAWEAVKKLPDEILGAKIVKVEIPTVFDRAASVIIDRIRAEGPDYILSIGQAGGRSAMTVEFVGINWQDGRIPDNEGFQPLGQVLEEDGAAAYFSTLPVKAMVCEMRKAQVPSFISYTAGTYVCNAVLYRTLHYIQKNKLDCRAGFIHVPYTPAQAVDKPLGTPTMDAATIAAGIEAAVRALLQMPAENPAGSMGQTE